MEGLFNENGPFVMGYKGKSLTINEYSWNRVASTLYIEYPIGVGFSYRYGDGDDDDIIRQQ